MSRRERQDGWLMGGRWGGCKNTESGVGTPDPAGGVDTAS